MLLAAAKTYPTIVLVPIGCKKPSMQGRELGIDKHITADECEISCLRGTGNLNFGGKARSRLDGRTRARGIGKSINNRLVSECKGGYVA